MLMLFTNAPNCCFRHYTTMQGSGSTAPACVQRNTLLWVTRQREQVCPTASEHVSKAGALMN